MQNDELINIWKSYDSKLDKVLSLNKKLIYELTKNNLRTTISTMKGPKSRMLLLGIPYTIFLYFISFIAFKAGGIFVTIGFGMISIIMSATIVGYLYQLQLVHHISRSQDIMAVQKKIAELKISTFNLARLAVLQLPFWSICWISFEALKNSPLWYGGINLIVFFGLTYLSYWLYKRISIDNRTSKVSQFFLSGVEWEPILKSSQILAQLKELENTHME